MAQGHLELAGVQGVVPPEIPEAALARHPEGPLALALAPHPDAVGAHARVAEDGHAVGAYPVVAAVVLLPLLVHPLSEHLFDLCVGQQLIELGLLLVIPAHQSIGAVQPVQQLLGHLLLEGHVLEVLQESPVKAVEVGLRLHQQCPAQVVKASEAGPLQPLVQGFHQSHPLGEGDLQAAAAQQIEKITEHTITASSCAGRRCPRSSSAARPDRAPRPRRGRGHSPRGSGPVSSR